MNTKNLYSASKNGFYAASLIDEFEALGSLPEDLIEVDCETYEYCMTAPSRGEFVAPGPDGLPVTVPVPAPTALETSNTNIARRDGLLSAAALRIDPLRDAVDLGIATPEEESLYSEWRNYRVLLSRVDVSTTAPAWPTTPGAA